MIIRVLKIENNTNNKTGQLVVSKLELIFYNSMEAVPKGSIGVVSSSKENKDSLSIIWVGKIKKGWNMTYEWYNHILDLRVIAEVGTPNTYKQL